MTAIWRGIEMKAFRIILLGVMIIMYCARAGVCSAEGSFEMEMVYKYSEQFRELTKGRPGWEHVQSQEWPRPGTPEFYHNLVMQDRHRHASRNLLTQDVYSLYPSNATYYMPSLGGIHYTAIALGTPAQTLLVALDTGSDLLWVPCDCKQCAVANWANYDPALAGLEFAIYSPSNSTSSKTVACNSTICTTSLSPTPCDVGATKSCTYIVNYAMANTSSSGTMVQDVLYLTLENGGGTANVTSDIYFGCGTTQTGGLLKSNAPDGLFGLGPDAFSVPSTLARNGVTKHVFSMCFSKPSDSGRLVFGRKPSASLQSTPLIPTSSLYVLGVEGFVAGEVKLRVSGNVLFDTGTSLTILPSAVVQVLGDAMSSNSTLKSFPFIYSNSILFNYCWNATTSAEIETLSSLSFVFGGGGTWTIASPFLAFGSNDTLDFVCLGIVSKDSANSPSIIGFNFMQKYEYFFDIGASTFSWAPSDCSGSNLSNTTLTPSSSAPSFSPESSPSSSTPSSSSPSSSPPNTHDLPQVPTSNVPKASNAHTRSLGRIPCQVLSLIVVTIYLLVASQSN